MVIAGIVVARMDVSQSIGGGRATHTKNVRRPWTAMAHDPIMCYVLPPFPDPILEGSYPK